jgi:small subunit ribosomal protein S11e
MAEQTEKSFQQQAMIFIGEKRVLGRKNKSGEQRYFKSVGLGFKTPKEAIEGAYFLRCCSFRSVCVSLLLMAPRAIDVDARSGLLQ